MAETLNDSQQAILSPALSSAAEAAGSTLTGLLTRQTTLQFAGFTGSSLSQAAGSFTGGVVNIKLSFSGGVTGKGVVFLAEKDAVLMADLMIGQDGSNPPDTLTDLYVSAAGEVCNQMATSFATAMAHALNKKVSVNAADLELTDAAGTQNFPGVVGADAVPVQLHLEIEGHPQTVVFLAMSFSVIKGLCAAGNAAPAASKTAAPASAGGFTAATTFSNAGQGGPTMVQSAQMTNMVPEAAFSGTPGNIELVMDVPLQITVELGRTHKTVREILSFGSGSVVELDKLAGEPVDILVNEKPIAKGEVVVIDENFGIRITEILSPHERIVL